jgi:hypothetical protein
VFQQSVAKARSAIAIRGHVREVFIHDSADHLLISKDFPDQVDGLAVDS